MVYLLEWANLNMTPNIRVDFTGETVCLNLFAREEMAWKEACLNWKVLDRCSSF